MYVYVFSFQIGVLYRRYKTRCGNTALCILPHCSVNLTGWKTSEDWKFFVVVVITLLTAASGFLAQTSVLE